MSSFPDHVGVIMDGNRRWARKRNLPDIEGHKKGKETAEKMINYFMKRGIKNISLYTMSHDNYVNRSDISELLSLHRDSLKELMNNGMLDKYEIRVRFIGMWELVNNPTLIGTIRDLIKETKRYTKRSLNLVFNYFTGKIQPKKQIKRELELPNLDLVVRTGSMPRTSGFLKLISTYANIYVTKKLYPDCTTSDFRRWLEFYKKQQNNYGK